MKKETIETAQNIAIGTIGSVLGTSTIFPISMIPHIDIEVVIGTTFVLGFGVAAGFCYLVDALREHLRECKRIRNKKRIRKIRANQLEQAWSQEPYDSKLHFVGNVQVERLGDVNYQKKSYKLDGWKTVYAYDLEDLESAVKDIEEE